MSLRRFRYFVAVAERESFSRAAADLHIAQSALSRHIAILEATVGAPLLERSTHGAKLTPVGRVMLEDARRLLGLVDATYDHARRVADGSTGQLSVSLIKLAVLSPIATGAIAAYIAARPRVDLQLTNLSSTEQLAALRDRKIDAGFIIERSASLSEIDYVPIVSDRFIVVMPEDHPLAAFESLTIDQLRDQPFVTVSMNHYWLGQAKLLAACHGHAFKPRVVLEVGGDVFLQLALIARGAGIGFANESVRNALPTGVVMRPVPELHVSLDVELVWMRANQDPVLADFVARIRDFVTPPLAGAAAATP
jgi:DNA-binding transcriptional LysR family regulator